MGEGEIGREGREREGERAGGSKGKRDGGGREERGEGGERESLLSSPSLLDSGNGLTWRLLVLGTWFSHPYCTDRDILLFLSPLTYCRHLLNALNVKCKCRSKVQKGRKGKTLKVPWHATLWIVWILIYR